MIAYPNVKINLGLNVLRKREDGYHDLETLFVPYFDIHDTLEIIKGDDYSCTSASLFARYSPDNQIVQEISEDGLLMMTIARKEGVDWSPLSDLCAKAYRLLTADYNLPPVKIFLEKTSPVGAGLGGGSADAAFTLLLLNDLFELNLSKSTLCDYASKLGSDCALFIYNTPMIGEGRGERLRPFELNLDVYDLKVIVPEGVSVSTAEAYRGISPRDTKTFVLPEGTEYLPLEEALKRPIVQWKKYIVNDFETTVFQAHPQLAAIKKSLYDSGSIYASMSGSGSALFAIYPKS